MLSVEWASCLDPWGDRVNRFDWSLQPGGLVRDAADHRDSTMGIIVAVKPAEKGRHPLIAMRVWVLWTQPLELSNSL